MDIEHPKGQSPVQFEPALKLGIMAIDGTWRRECLLIEASDTEGQLIIAGSMASIEEFFLMLSSVGHPAFRRCKRVWVNGDRIGVKFEKRQLTKFMLT